jgi:hypothetical protein
MDQFRRVRPRLNLAEVDDRVLAEHRLIVNAYDWLIRQPTVGAVPLPTDYDHGQHQPNQFSRMDQELLNGLLTQFLDQLPEQHRSVMSVHTLAEQVKSLHQAKLDQYRRILGQTNNDIDQQITYNGHTDSDLNAFYQIVNMLVNPQNTQQQLEGTMVRSQDDNTDAISMSLVLPIFEYARPLDPDNGEMASKYDPLTHVTTKYGDVRVNRDVANAVVAFNSKSDFDKRATSLSDVPIYIIITNDKHVCVCILHNNKLYSFGVNGDVHTPITNWLRKVGVPNQLITGSEYAMYAYRIAEPVRPITEEVLLPELATNAKDAINYSSNELVPEVGNAIDAITSQMLGIASRDPLATDKQSPRKIIDIGILTLAHIDALQKYFDNVEHVITAPRTVDDKLGYNSVLYVANKQYGLLSGTNTNTLNCASFMQAIFPHIMCDFMGVVGISAPSYCKHTDPNKQMTTTRISQFVDVLTTNRTTSTADLMMLDAGAVLPSQPSSSSSSASWHSSITDPITNMFRRGGSRSRKYRPKQRRNNRKYHTLRYVRRKRTTRNKNGHRYKKHGRYTKRHVRRR